MVKTLRVAAGLGPGSMLGAAEVVEAAVGVVALVAAEEGGVPLLPLWRQVRNLGREEVREVVQPAHWSLP